MDSTSNFEIEVCGEERFVQALANDLKGTSGDIELLSTRPEKDETKLALGLGALATAVLVVKGLYYTSMLASKLLEWMKKSNARRISLTTPYNQIEITYRHDLTEEEVRSVLRRAAEL